MSLDFEDRELAPLLARLHPHARDLLARAGVQALRLHADGVSPEHLLTALMDDPHCAAHAAVLHAFADPATISDEALAISPGLMVVASGSTLPFSPRAAEAIARARSRSLAEGKREVAVADLLAQAVLGLDEGARDSLRAAGLRTAADSRSAGPAPPLGSAVFKFFSASAKRVLSAANRLAAAERATAISPAHLLLGCLKEDAEVASEAGLSFHRARTLLAGRMADESSPHPRSLPPDPALVEFLRGVSAGSDSLELLARFHSGRTPELAGILTRSKVTTVLMDRARQAFRDPDPMQDPGPPRR
jgi:ATP-dependent Clp protease ATP-binding subunit ClpA